MIQISPSTSFTPHLIFADAEEFALFCGSTDTLAARLLDKSPDVPVWEWGAGVTGEAVWESGDGVNVGLVWEWGDGIIAGPIWESVDGLSVG